MNPYSPIPARERLALGLFSAVVSLSLMASVSVLFSDRGLPWSPHLIKSLKKDPVCVAGSAGAGGCPAVVARANAQTPAPAVLPAPSPAAHPKASAVATAAAH